MDRTKTLLRVAHQTLVAGDREAAAEYTVLALRTEDAIDALDKLLPHIPDPASDEEVFLTEEQTAALLAFQAPPEIQARLKSCVEASLKTKK